MRFSSAASALAALAVAAAVSIPDGKENVALAVGSVASFGKASSGLVRRDMSSQSKGSSLVENAPATPHWHELIGYCDGESGAVKRYGPLCAGANEAGTNCEADAATVTTLAQCKAKCLFACRGIGWSGEVAGGGELGNDQCVIYEGGCDDSGAGTDDARAGMTFYKKPELPPWSMVNWVHMSGGCEGYSFMKRYGAQCSGTRGGQDCEPDYLQVTNLAECKARCVPDGSDNECLAVGWLAVPDQTKTDTCITYYGECLATGDLEGLVFYEKPADQPVRLAGEAEDAKCNSYTGVNNAGCPAASGWFLRKEAPDISCKSPSGCTEANDKLRCCKSLSKEASGKKCSRSAALNWRSSQTLEECVFWAINNGIEFFAFGTGEKANRCWWQRSTAPPYCQGEACCHCGKAWEAHFTKVADNMACTARFGVIDEAGTPAGCATACRSTPGCTTFSFGVHNAALPDHKTCRVSMCNDPDTGTFPAQASHPTGACGAGSGFSLDADTLAGSCGAGAKTNAAFYSIKVAVKTTYTYGGGAVLAGAGSNDVATLAEAQWNQDYCLDFELKFPDEMNRNLHGIGGVVALLGDYASGTGLQILVTHSSKLYRTATGGNKFGLLAREKKSGGAVFATTAFAKYGETHKARFCYLAGPGGQINLPSWEVDGAKATADYLELTPGGPLKPPFPSTRNSALNLFPGDGTSKMAGNAKLESFKIDHIEACEMKADEYDFYKLA